MMEKYGTDSFRFFLAATLPEGKDILFDESRLDGYRSFCNKIWNSSRFILMNLEESFVPTGITSEIEKDLEPMDQWILSRFNRCLEEYNKAHSKFHFYEMAAAIYEFIWGDFCDWYIELVKPRAYGKVSPQSTEVAKQVLSDVLIRALGLLHPFMPFLTEEVHSVFSNQYIVTTPFPEAYPISYDAAGVQKLNLLQEIVTKIRVMRSENGIAPDKKCKTIVKSEDDITRLTISENEVSLLQLARLESIRIEATYEIQKTDSVSHFTKGEIILPLEGLIDIEKEKARLNKELQKSEVEKEKLEAKLSNPGFLSKAAPDVVEKEREKLKIFTDKVEVLKKGIQNLAS